ncbi:ParA family partition ATPase [Nitrospirillum sp. BR 11828]|uniref:ParA family partition ATPase n=1 Tax=Nitrospirillum sp. BR 11828 TaxID=3104325 RepID=UPI002ACA780C|nr:ParA family partition ATPase [Nitrospirillum sp. BR 11828]MDZ5649381.1 ParA family partition ATPase [Nitrospirillum sp. BR 11828]
MAGHVVTIAQQKGGAGKTTLAIQLAVAWSLAGLRVAVVDIDPQGSLTAWFGLRTQALDDPGLTHMQINGWRTQKEVERLAREHDVVVVDSPPHAETEARIAVRVADLVVVPVQPSPMDLWATRPTLDMAKTEKRPVLVTLNRVPPRAKLADRLTEAVAGLGVPMAEAVIGNRVGFAGAMMDGLSLQETDRRAKGSEEIAALAGEILARLGGTLTTGARSASA